MGIFFPPLVGVGIILFLCSCMSRTYICYIIVALDVYDLQNASIAEKDGLISEMEGEMSRLNSAVQELVCLFFHRTGCTYIRNKAWSMCTFAKTS